MTDRLVSDRPAPEGTNPGPDYVTGLSKVSFRDPASLGWLDQITSTTTATSQTATNTSQVQVWCLLIDHEKKAAYGDASRVNISADADIEDLTKKIKEERSDVLENVVPATLTVWRCTGQKLLASSNKEELEKELSEVDLTDKSRAKQLGVGEEIKTLGLSRNEILLIEVPASEGGKDIMPADERFNEDLRRSAIEMSGVMFLNSDLAANRVSSVSLDDDAVKHYRHVLEIRRKVPTGLKDNVDAIRGHVSDDGNSDEASELDERALFHMLLSAKSVPVYPNKWTEYDARGLLFYNFANYAHAQFATKNRSVKSGFSNLWPISLPILFRGDECRYTPKSDFFLAIHNVPCIVAEVKSVGAEDDRAPMRLSSASLIRLVNGLLRSKGAQNGLVVMGLYLDDIRHIERELLYEAGDGEVKYRKETFSNTPNNRCLVIEEMYNLLHGMTSLWDALKGLENDLKAIHNTLQSKPAWTTAKTGTKRGADDAGHAGRRRTNPQIEGGQSGSTAPTVSGYEVVDWTVSKRKPQNLFAVRRVKDRKRFVAKVIEHADEKRILEFLHKKDPTGAYVIPLESTVSSNLGDMVLLPERHCVRQLVMTRREGELPGIFIHFAEQFIKGVAFLHRQLVAHLDIKPDNLVYTDSYQVQIIDFDVAMQLEDENEEIDVELGTHDYAAPEIGRRDIEDRLIPYSPILADRYSCGVTIGEFLLFDRKWGQREDLENLADRLKDEEPYSRPSLLEWTGKDRVTHRIADFTVPQKRSYKYLNSDGMP